MKKGLVYFALKRTFSPPPDGWAAFVLVAVIWLFANFRFPGGYFLWVQKGRKFCVVPLARPQYTP